MKPNLRSLIEGLANRHCLKSAPDDYRNAFIAAVENVYNAAEIEKILRDRFFIPEDNEYDSDKYLQSAAELSVQNYLKLCNTAKAFAAHKNVNPENAKDVDAYYEVGATRVSLEVKCPQEERIPGDSFVIKSAGRTQDFFEKAAVLQKVFEESESKHKLAIAKKKDNTMKEFLVSANAKFSPDSGFNHLNILFVACGNEGNLMEWSQYLIAGHGLFTTESFSPPSQFALVDVVLLSNLKYLHSDARQSHDWTLRNAFLLPFINRHKRQSSVSESIGDGLSVFDHHLKRFNQYKPDRDLSGQFKVGHYIVYGLTKEERSRYFPAKPVG